MPGQYGKFVNDPGVKSGVKEDNGAATFVLFPDID